MFLFKIQEEVHRYAITFFRTTHNKNLFSSKLDGIKGIGKVKKNQIFGIEYEEGAFGLSSTNMLIHGDGNSNVIQNSMFKCGKWIEDNNINIVLMNPPYNAIPGSIPTKYKKSWTNAEDKKTDPTKGFVFIHFLSHRPD